jgi:hypothetical protein
MPKVPMSLQKSYRSTILNPSDGHFAVQCWWHWHNSQEVKFGLSIQSGAWWGNLIGCQVGTEYLQRSVHKCRK